MLFKEYEGTLRKLWKMELEKFIMAQKYEIHEVFFIIYIPINI